jgi:D-arabinitol 2-dehydrogenase
LTLTVSVIYSLLLTTFTYDCTADEEAQRQANAMLTLYEQENPKTTRTPKITTHHADVSSSASINAAIASILSLHSKIDNLVACAGYCENIPAISYPEDRLNRLWGVNVNGQLFACTAVAKYWMDKGRGGTIVNIGSISGSIVNVPQPQAVYNASKAAVRHLSASLAVEWAESKIRVNCISPGYMLTAAAM